MLFVGLFLLFSIVILFSLKKITKWGQSSVIPNIINLTIDQAEDKIDAVDLDYEIKDTVYRKDLKEGTIIEVQPSIGLEIKSGRTIFLVISSKRPPMVEMPNLVGRSSLRFAKIELESRGLILGNLSYIPSSEKDAVLVQKIGNTEVKGGTQIPKGTTIHLTLGDGLTGIVISPPFVIGKSYRDVQEILNASGISANYYFDKDVEDTSKTVVYRQYPSALNDEKINMGETMDIFLGKKIPQNILRDSALRARLNMQ